MLLLYTTKHCFFFTLMLHLDISFVPFLYLYQLLFDNLNTNRYLPYNLPGALQWHWFVLIGILSVYPRAVKREEPPQYYVPILRKLGTLWISSPPTHRLLSLRDGCHQ